MHNEVEARFLEIDVNATREKLLACGFVCAIPERLMRRTYFDVSENEKSMTFLRIRAEGDKTTLTMKIRQNEHGANDTQELETTIGDFDTVREMLDTIGFSRRNPMMENKRETWRRGAVEAELDTYPNVPTYLEIEAPDEETVRAVAVELGFDWNNARFEHNIIQLYLGYNANDVDFDTTFANPQPRIK